VNLKIKSLFVAGVETVERLVKSRMNPVEDGGAPPFLTPPPALATDMMLAEGDTPPKRARRAALELDIID
jgi:hypothetical protein